MHGPLVDVPIASMRPRDTRSLFCDGFINACTASLPPVIIPVPPAAGLVPFTPRHSDRIAKFRGTNVPGTLSWAQKTIICQLGLAERPEQIDDGTLQRYKDFFTREATPAQLAALRELFPHGVPCDVDVAAHSAQIAAC